MFNSIYSIFTKSDIVNEESKLIFYYFPRDNSYISEFNLFYKAPIF